MGGGRVRRDRTASGGIINLMVSAEKPGLAEALAAAQARHEVGNEQQAVPLSDESLARGIDLLCAAFGEDPLKVARDLRGGTALARLLRKMLGAERIGPRPRGRPRASDAQAFDELVFEQFRRVTPNAEEARDVAAQLLAEWGRTGRGGQPISEEGVRSSIRRKRKPPGQK